MIQKRFQKFTKKGIEWTEWFTINSEGSQEEALALNKSEKWQLKNKLKNEFKYVYSA